MTLSDKAQKDREAIIKRYGSYEAYLDIRYRNPEKAEQRSRAASIAGKATKKRTFNDPKKAAEAGRKSWENRRGNQV